MSSLIGIRHERDEILTPVLIRERLAELPQEKVIDAVMACLDECEMLRKMWVETEIKRHNARRIIHAMGHVVVENKRLLKSSKSKKAQIKKLKAHISHLKAALPKPRKLYPRVAA